MLACVYDLPVTFVCEKKFSSSWKEGSFVLLPTMTWQRLLTYAVTWSRDNDWKFVASSKL